MTFKYKMLQKENEQRKVLLIWTLDQARSKLDFAKKNKNGPCVVKILEQSI
jgi:hypothetical protein